MELLTGIICGILLSLFFSLGPAFFSLIQNSIHHGFKKAISFAAGVSLSDGLVVLLMLTVLSNLDLDALLHNVYVSIIGGIAIGIFGVLTYRSKVKSTANKESRLKFSTETATHRWQLALTGFLLNILNPLIWLYWVSIITFLSAELNLSSSERYLFFLGMLLAVFGTDVLKCRLASLLQNIITARIMNLFNKITGGILMAFSVYLIVSMILYQTRGQEEPKSDNKEQLMHKVHNLVHREGDKQKDTVAVLPADLDSLVTDTLAPADSLAADDIDTVGR